MRRRTFGIYASVLGASVASVGVSRAATLQVGPGATYSTPCAAIAEASTGDVVEVAPGTYTDTCAIGVKGVTVRGVNGRPKIDLSGTDHPAHYKGAYVITADDVRVENLEISGVHISPQNGENGAGIRIEANGAVISGCYIHDNQNGVLGGPSSPGTGTLTIEHSELSKNGMGDGCNGSGCTHNVYVFEFAKVVFQYNWSHALANDTADKGHLLKSRADATYVLYNIFTGEDGPSSYEVDMPNGGLGVVVGNVIQQGNNTGNPTMLSYGAEGLARQDHRLFVVNNTFVNDLDKGTFINATAGTTLEARNNLFVGAGTPSSLGALSSDNLAGVDPLFVNRAAFDYHLQSGSPAIDKGVAPGTADAFDLTPAFEYAPALRGIVRTSHAAIDVGAFEFGTDLSGASGSPGSPPANVDAGMSTGSASPSTGAPVTPVAPGASGAGNGVRNSSGEPSAMDTDTGDSSCNMSRARPSEGRGRGTGAASVVGMLAAIVTFARRRRTRA